MSVAHRSFLLEATPASFRPTPAPTLVLERVDAPGWERARALWLCVGRGFWTVRSRWPQTRWCTHLQDRSVVFRAARAGSEDAGFFELHVRHSGVRIEGFGLVPSLRGRGMGSGLLSLAMQEAFGLGARRVWLHTATDDHPNALPNYLARGFSIYREGVLRDPVRPARARGVAAS